MPLFSYMCPRCNKISLTDPLGKCMNRLNSGVICGYQLPFKYENVNRYLKDKWDKHTTPPVDPSTNTQSWVKTTDLYGQHRKSVLTQGTVALNPDLDHLFLWHAPLGDKPIAQVLYATAGTVAEANGIIAPLNSKLQNVHNYYGNWQKDWETVASGWNLIIEEPCDSHPDKYVVIKDNKVIYWFNPNINRSSP